MATNSSEQSLRDLEHSQLPPLELLGLIGTILGVSIDDISSRFLSDPTYKPLPLPFTPREEWVLRWLLKKSDLTARGSDSSRRKFICNPRTWALFLYLANTIPWENLTRILQERDFFPKLGEKLQLVLQSLPGSPFSDASEIGGERRPKRRKLVQDTGPNARSSTTPLSNHSGAIGLLICRSIIVCTKPSHESSLPSSAWGLLPVQAAELISLLLEIVLSGLQIISHSWQAGLLVSLIGDIVSCWDVACRLENSLSEFEKSRVYHDKCCQISSAILIWLDQSSVNTEYLKPARKNLEYMISLHTIMPLRAALNEAVKSGWTKENTLITWDKFDQVCTMVKKHFDCVAGFRRSENENLYDYAMPRRVPILLDVAIRSIPLTNLRRRQREQPWLETFFLSLIYLAYPSMPRMEVTPEGYLSKIDIVQDQNPGECMETIEALLKILLKRSINISLPVSSYLFSAILACEFSESIWPCLARIFELNHDVLLTNSGLKNTTHCLDRVCTRIRDSESHDVRSYEILRGQIIIPLISGFAQARDLGSFVKIWLRGLENTIASRTFLGIKNTDFSVRLIWDDEDVFAAFSEVARKHAIPSLTRNLLAETLEALQSLMTRVGSTADVFARLAVLDIFLSSCPGQFGSILSSLHKLLDGILAALKVTSTFQSQRWRLWRVLRHGLILEPDFELSYDYLQPEASPIRVVSVGSVEHISSSQSKSEVTAALRELVECFHLIMASDFGPNVDIVDVRRSELSKLSLLLDHCSKKTKDEYVPLWDGRTSLLTGTDAVVEACVGILCQNPQYLLADPTTTKKLLKSLFKYTESVSALASLKQTQQNLVEALLSHDELSGRDALYRHFFEALVENINDHGEAPTSLLDSLQRMPLNPIPRSLLQKLATLIETQLRNSNPSAKSEDLVSAMAILEKLTKSAAVSMGKPQNWKQLVDLASTLDKRVSVGGSKACPVLMRCLRGILASLWKRMIALENSEKNRKLISDMYNWCVEMVESDLSLSAELFKFTLLTSIVDGLWKNEDVQLLATLKLDKRTTFLRNSLFRRLLEDLSKLSQPAAFNKDSAFVLWCLVRAMSWCSDLCQKSSEFQSLIAPTDKAIENLMKIARDEEVLAGLSTSSILEISRARFSLLAANCNQSNQQDLPPMANFQRLTSKAQDNKFMTPIKRARWAFEYVDAIGPENYAALLSLLRTDSNIGVLRYELTAAVAHRSTQFEVKETPELVQHLNDLASLQFANEARSPESLCMALECGRIILDGHPEVVNQWAIDNLLSSIAILATSSGQSNTASPAALENQISNAIFTRLCDLLGMILKRFRRRLQGRYHLLLPATQNLLRCLFYPGTTAFEAGQSQSQNQMQFVHTLPFWIRASAFPLKPASATKYARLLSSICNPTGSSVRSATKGRPHSMTRLTDETNKAKRTAGHYMQYLITEYAKCSLDGQISPEAKENLMPGLYGVLNVMPRELMRAMNAAMDASSRAIFKVLYDDYQRLGKWDKD